jgi:hypothetical protein
MAARRFLPLADASPTALSWTATDRAANGHGRRAAAPLGPSSDRAPHAEQRAGGVGWRPRRRRAPAIEDGLRASRRPACEGPRADRGVRFVNDSATNVGRRGVDRELHRGSSPSSADARGATCGICARSARASRAGAIAMANRRRWCRTRPRGPARARGGVAGGVEQALRAARPTAWCCSRGC